MRSADVWPKRMPSVLRSVTSFMLFSCSYRLRGAAEAGRQPGLVSLDAVQHVEAPLRQVVGHVEALDQSKVESFVTSLLAPCRALRLVHGRTGEGDRVRVEHEVLLV